MEVNIRELLEGLEDSSVPMKDEYVVSATRIKELTKMKMESQNRKPYIGTRRRIITFALAAVLVIAMGATALAASPYIFGWANNLVIDTTGGEGTLAQGTLSLEEMTEPVEFVNGRMIFIVNGEHIDITDVVSESEAFMYEYTDDGGITHYWMVGLTGPEMENYGYGEFLYKPGSGWVGGQGHNHVAHDGETAEWFVNGKAELNVPWR